MLMKRTFNLGGMYSNDTMLVHLVSLTFFYFVGQASYGKETS